MRGFKRLLSVLVFFILAHQLSAQLIITQQSDAQALAQKLVGSGVTISNVQITGNGQSTGFFRHVGGTQLNLDSGIVLSTGRVLTNGSLYGLNGAQFNLASNQMNTPGDPDLGALVAPQSTLDAVVLEFDFVPLGDTVKFNYVFSSDEYPSFTCSNFNDVFAFFISGPGITGSRNLALVPGTNIPVAINSINSGIPGGSYQLSTCQGMGPGSPFTQYYVNNSGNSFFTHNGFTKVLTAKSAVQPCQTYHLKIAIADVLDRSYDSNVFIDAESLESDPIQIEDSLPVFNGLPYVVEGCQPGGIMITRAKKSPNPQQVNLSFAGNAINGTDVQLIPSTAIIPAGDSVVFVPITTIVDNVAEGTEFLKIYISNGCTNNNFFPDSITIQLREYDTLSITPEYKAICKNSPIQLQINNTYSSYAWTPSATLSNAAIQNPVASPVQNTTYIATAVTGDCHARDSVRLDIKSMEFYSQTNINCKNGTTGKISVGGGYEWTSPVQYNINTTGYINDSTFSNLPAGTYTVRVKDATGCIDSMAVTLIQAFPDLLLTDNVISASCSGANGQVQLTASGGLQPYSYKLDNGNYVASPNFTVNGGNHTISVKDQNGCITTDNVSITNDPPLTVSTSASAASCSGSPDGTIFVAANGGSGQYLYSIDGVNFQTANNFFVNVGNLTVTVKDNKGCTASETVSIPLNQTVFVNAGNDTTICEGSSIKFNTSANAVNFIWNSDPTLSSTTISNPVASPVTTTTYYVTAIKDICTVYDTITVEVRPAPVANAGPDSSICVGKSIELNGSGGLTYEWTPSTLVSDPSIPNPIVSPAQTTKYFLRVFNMYNCPSLKYDTVIISMVPAVQAFAGRDTSITVGQPLQLNALDMNNSGATIFEWKPAFGLNNPNIYNPVATLTEDFTYQLKLITPEGCEGTDQISIKVFKGPDIFVPSGFTPNDDGRNDRLRPFPVGMKELHFFRVYNRWGQLIFSTSTETKGWDGRINGVTQATGTYIWVAEAVDYKGNVIVRKGVSTLIR